MKWVTTVIRDEIKYLFGGKIPLILIIFFVPLLFSVLFGFVYQNNVVNHIPLAIYDQDQSNLSRQLIQMYDDAERFDISVYVNNQQELEDCINNGTALAVLQIPRDFSKDVKQGRASNILFITNSANNMFGNAAISTTQEISRTFTVAVAKSMLQSGGVLPDAAMHAAYPVQLGVRILNNPANGYSSFMLAGLMMNGFQIGLMICFAPTVVTELLRRRYGKECPSLAILAGKIVPYWLASIPAFYMSLAVCVFGFAVPMRGSWLDAGVLAGTFAFFVLGVLMIFSACCPSRELSLQAPMVYIMPGLLYSGLSWPSFSMNTVAYAVSFIMPMTRAGDNLRDIMLAGYAPVLWSDAAAMAVGGLISMGIALGVVSFRRHDMGHRLLAKWKRGGMPT
jgi:ABC-2 type transport system permease protein